MGLIISLLDVIHAVKLIPEHGVAVKHEVMKHTWLRRHVRQLGELKLSIS